MNVRIFNQKEATAEQQTASRSRGLPALLGVCVLLASACHRDSAKEATDSPSEKPMFAHSVSNCGTVDLESALRSFAGALYEPRTPSSSGFHRRFDLDGPGKSGDAVTCSTSFEDEGGEALSPGGPEYRSMTVGYDMAHEPGDPVRLAHSMLKYYDASTGEPLKDPGLGDEVWIKPDKSPRKRCARGFKLLVRLSNLIVEFTSEGSNHMATAAQTGDAQRDRESGLACDASRVEPQMRQSTVDFAKASMEKIRSTRALLPG